MKDIDFDELDKAVNSLMGNIKDQSDQPVPKTLNISTTLKENEAPEYTKLEQVAQKIGSETIGGPTERTAILPDTSGDDPLKTLDLTGATSTVPTPVVNEAPVMPVASTNVETPAIPPSESNGSVARTQPVAARRSSGRFMDVMHPSSDMKTTAPTSPSAAPSREAATIAPPSHAEDTAPEVGAEPVSNDLVETEAAHEVSKEVSTTGTLDPLVPEPLSSPFLPDAKVEKRPLGSPAPDTSDTPDALGEHADAQLAPDATQTVEELPEELHDDLLAIETNLAVEEPSLPEEVAVDSGASTPDTAGGKTEEVASGPASIPQQYKELPSSGDQSNGAIFDVEDYHKQPAHPAKGGKAWLWIVLIIVIIIVSAGGGAAFYLLGAK